MADWGQALMSGVGAGLTAYGGQAMKEQSAEADEARWIKRNEMLEAQRAEAEKQKQRYLLGLKPPESRTVKTTDANGKPIQRTEEWVPDVEKGTGSFRTIGEQPDINFERLEETQRHNTESEQLRSAADQARMDAQTARLGLERERLERAKGGSAEAAQPKPYTFGDKIRYGTFNAQGVFVPAKDEQGNDISGDKYRPSVFAEKRAAKAEGVKGTLKQVASALGLDAMADAVGGYAPSTPAPAASGAPAAKSAANHGAIVRTGKDAQGRRVVKYADGTIEVQG